MLCRLTPPAIEICLFTAAPHAHFLTSQLFQYLTCFQGRFTWQYGQVKRNIVLIHFLRSLPANKFVNRSRISFSSSVANITYRANSCRTIIPPNTLNSSLVNATAALGLLFPFACFFSRFCLDCRHFLVF